jgi:acetyl-CoA acyltransferase 1
MAFLCRRSFAEENGLPVLAKFLSYHVVGVEPHLFGKGPAEAIPGCLAKAGISTKDVDIYEVNEAFANVAMYTIDHLGLDPKKVNPNGGAIALGHPLACTGARMLATLMNELDRQKKNVGVISMCIGTGMGAAALIEM